MRNLTKKFLSLCLTGALLIGLMTPALASYDTYGPITTPLTVTNSSGRTIHFLDIYGGETKSRADLVDEVTFYKDAVTSNGFLQDWASIAYNIFKSQPKSYYDHAGDGWDTDYGNGHYIDFVYDMQHPRSVLEEDGIANENVYGVIATGLSVADSLKEVQKRAADDIASLPDRKLDGDDFLGQHPIDALTDTKQTVLYSTVTTFDRYGRTEQIAYDSFTIAFYDFQLHVLSSEDELQGEVSTKTGTVQDGFVTITENYGLEDIQDSGTLKKSVTESVSSTISNSESYTFGESFGSTISITEKFPDFEEIALNLNMNVSYSEAMETAYSETTSITETIDSSCTVTKNLPAHTKELGQQTISETAVTTTYDCPVGLSYKVAIFSMCGTCYDDNALTQAFNTAGYEQRSFVTLFGASVNAFDAVESLYQRATNHADDVSYDETYGNVRGTNDEGSVWCTGLNWNTILSQGTPASKSANGLKGGTDLIYALDDTYPMSLSGGSTTILQTSITTEEGTAMPIYPIASVYIPWQNGEDMEQDRSFELTVGDSHPITSYRVKACDKDAVEYNGFVPTSGTWKIVDTSGQEAFSDVAKMVCDPVTGAQTLVATAPGTTYVKYFIPEDTYYTYDGVVSTNANIKSAAYKVVVSAPPEEEPEPFEGSILVEGSVAATVGETINLNSELTATAYDATGKEADVNVSWEAQELESKGVSVSPDGALTTTQPGTFHVRAYVDSVYSQWVEVISEEPTEPVQTICYHTYTDVPHDKWYDPAVEFVFQNHLMKGDGSSTFNPHGTVSRAMVAQVLYNAAGKPLFDGESHFEDVVSQAWYAKAVAWAAAQGITTGRTDTHFAPMDSVTREELATLLIRYALSGLTDLSTIQDAPVLADFPDAGQVSGWAEETLSQALDAGLIAGRTDGTLDPKGTATRAELAQMLMNLLAQ